MNSKHLYDFSYCFITLNISKLDNHALGSRFQVAGDSGANEESISLLISGVIKFWRNQHVSLLHVLLRLFFNKLHMSLEDSLVMGTSGCLKFHLSRNLNSWSSVKQLKSFFSGCGLHCIFLYFIVFRCFAEAVAELGSNGLFAFPPRLRVACLTIIITHIILFTNSFLIYPLSILYTFFIHSLSVPFTNPFVLQFWIL